jgi:tripeptidyl-peptidase-1
MAFRLSVCSLAFGAVSAWEWHSRAGGHESVELTFALKQQNLEQLETVLLEVSDPMSAKYGHHLSRDEVNALVAPTVDDVSAVLNWLEGVGEVQEHSDFITCVTNVSQAESLMGGEYHEFRHPLTGFSALRMQTKPVLPASVKTAIDFVSPTNQQLPRKLPVRVSHDLGSTGFKNTPTTLRKMYSIGDVEASNSRNRQAVTGFLEQHRTNVDLQRFFSGNYKKAKGRKISRTVGDGKDEKHTGGQIEAELDTQYVMAIGGNVDTEFWSFVGRAPNEPENEPFLKFLTTLSSTSDDEVPLVISTSYGEDEDNTDLDYAKRCNVEFQKAGARGITLLFSSGDSGVAGIGGSMLNDTSACKSDCDNGADCFVPQWPAASPYVTSVGGTKSYPGRPEQVDGLSSGGFSIRWPRPSWQSDAVEKYLQNTDTDMPDPKKYRSAGRGFPDIAAQSENYMVTLDLIPYPVSGTSCASPTVAGIISLLNDLRLNAGKPPLGFINPLLYSQLANSLTDIVTGSNPGCDSKGFPAKAGWDPATGLGTPIYDKMAAVVQSMTEMQILL